jgi:hypothetical protein
MGEMGNERGRYTNLSIRKLCKIAVCENGSGEVAREPAIDIWAHRFDRVERQRRSAIYVCMKQTDAGIESDGVQGYAHLGCEKRVKEVQEGIPRRRRPEGFPGQL